MTVAPYVAFVGLVALVVSLIMNAFQAVLNLRSERHRVEERDRHALTLRSHEERYLGVIEALSKLNETSANIHDLLASRIRRKPS